MSGVSTGELGLNRTRTTTQGMSGSCVCTQVCAHAYLEGWKCENIHSHEHMHRGQGPFCSQ